MPTRASRRQEFVQGAGLFVDAERLEACHERCHRRLDVRRIIPPVALLTRLHFRLATRQPAHGVVHGCGNYYSNQAIVINEINVKKL